MNSAVNESLSILKKSKVLLYPTDTVWGIGCDATDEKAVQKIYQLKKQRRIQKSYYFGRFHRNVAKICRKYLG